MEKHVEIVNAFWIRNTLVLRLRSDEYPLGFLLKFKWEYAMRLITGYGHNSEKDLIGAMCLIDDTNGIKTYIAPRRDETQY